jgi:hypothetical protein
MGIWGLLPMQERNDAKMKLSFYLCLYAENNRCYFSGSYF